MPASSVSSEIRQLMARGPSTGPQAGKKMPQRQAIAVALSMKRRGAFRKPGGRTV
jgi:hypothetical protein